MYKQAVTIGKCKFDIFAGWLAINLGVCVVCELFLGLWLQNQLHSSA